MNKSIRDRNVKVNELASAIHTVIGGREFGIAASALNKVTLGLVYRLDRKMQKKFAITQMAVVGAGFFALEAETAAEYQQIIDKKTEAIELELIQVFKRLEDKQEKQGKE